MVQGYVKNEEIEETASKNAEEEPIQDINYRSESDEEDREPSVHVDIFLKERERVTRPVMHSQHRNREKK